MSEHMVPRSLRWGVHPQQGDTDLESWYKYFNEAGTKFLNFLITRKRNRLSVLDSQIKEFKDGLLIYKKSIEYHFLSSNLQAPLIKEDRDQRNKKHKQYSRDIGDYKSETVFGITSYDPDPAMEVGITSSSQPNGGVASEHQTHPNTKPSTTHVTKGYQLREGSSFQKGCHPNTHKLSLIHIGVEVRTQIGGVIEVNPEVIAPTLEITNMNRRYNIREVLLHDIMTILPLIQILSNAIIPHLPLITDSPHFVTLIMMVHIHIPTVILISHLMVIINPTPIPK